MTRNVRTYDHVCAVARALERIGDRWTLLVIRDLLPGPRRFTDLMDRLGGITPKTLSQRLRELGDDGIVAVDREPGRREVWYRLTPAGAELAPVIDTLRWWGLRHAWRFPGPGESPHPEHMLRNAVMAIERASDDQSPAVWHFRLDGADYLASSDGQGWSVTPGAPSAAPPSPADVTVTADTRSLGRLIFSGSDAGVDITGSPAAVQRFRKLIGTMATVVDAGETGVVTG